jgi:hypothetical protein
MKHLRILEALVTKHLVMTIVLTTIIGLGTLGTVAVKGSVEVDTLATVIDATLKTLAIIVGAIWSLNRYFIGRTDVIQLRVDSDVSIIRDTQSGGENSDLALLVYRLDVVNTGKVVIPSYDQYLNIDAVTPSPQGVQYEPLYRWPSAGMHSGGHIEPGSWSAINDAISVPANLSAVRLYLEVQPPEESNWTWHKTFDVSRRHSDA